MMASFVLTGLFITLGCGLLFIAWVASVDGPSRSWWVASAICLGLAAWGIADMARAQSGRHGDGHAENHDWYKELKQPGTGFSCCNGTVNGVDGDCRPVRAEPRDDGLWWALLDGRWVPVPPRVVLEQLAPDGKSHICASKSGMIHCFLGGSPKS